MKVKDMKTATSLEVTAGGKVMFCCSFYGQLSGTFLRLSSREPCFIPRYFADFIRDRNMKVGRQTLDCVEQLMDMFLFILVFHALLGFTAPTLSLLPLFASAFQSSAA